MPQQNGRRSRLMNGHAASNDSAFADANGDSQRNGSPLPSAQQGAAPPKSRRVRLAQVTNAVMEWHMAFEPCTSAGWSAEPHGLADKLALCCTLGALSCPAGVSRLLLIVYASLSA
jgi:hypothetical protein